MYRERTVLLRLTQGDKVLYEGEVLPGHKIERDGVLLEVLWIRKHGAAPKSSATKGPPGDHSDPS